MAASIRSVLKLTEEDIPDASLAGRLPSQLKIEELKFWLLCLGDSCKGLKKKRQNSWKGRCLRSDCAQVNYYKPDDGLELFSKSQTA